MSMYDVRYSGAGGCGMSDVYMLKSVAKRTPPFIGIVLCMLCVLDIVCYKFDLIFF